MKSKFLICLAFACISYFSNAQIKKQATARIFESSSIQLSKIVVVYENGENESIPLKNLKLFGGSSATNSILIENQITINQFLNDMTEKGYSIDEMTTTGENFLYTFIIFSKEENTEE